MKIFSNPKIKFSLLILILFSTFPHIRCGGASETATAQSTGSTGPQGPAGPEGPQGSAGASWRPLGMTATALTAVAGNNLTVNGTASASAQTDAHYINWASAATANSVAGLTQGFNQTKGRLRPVLKTLIRTDSTIDNRRVWVALASASLSTSDAVGATTARYVGVRYSAATGDLNWQCASGDGSTGSVVDTGVAVNADSTYLITLDWSVNGTLTCTINGVSVSKTSELDTTQTANLGIQNSLTTLTALARNHRIAYIRLKYNGNEF